MRDPQIVIGDGVIVCGMATQARRRESLLSKYVFQHHKAFRGRDLFWVDFMESADVRSRTRRRSKAATCSCRRRDLLLVGVTERTNARRAADRALR
jgi:arginine deiminase